MLSIDVYQVLLQILLNTLGWKPFIIESGFQKNASPPPSKQATVRDFHPLSARETVERSFSPSRGRLEEDVHGLSLGGPSAIL